MSGCPEIASVIACENFSRSTASAARPPARDAHVRRQHHERSEAPHLFFQQSDGVVELVAAQRVGAHELGQLIGLVHGGRPHRPHLVEDDADTGAGSLPGCLGPREPAADDVDGWFIQDTRRLTSRSAGKEK